VDLPGLRSQLEYVGLRVLPWGLAAAGLLWGMARGGAWRAAALVAGAGFLAATGFHLIVGSLTQLAYRYLMPAVVFQHMLAWLCLLMIQQGLQGMPSSRRGFGARKWAIGFLALALLVSTFHTRSNTGGPSTRFHVALGHALVSAKYRALAVKAFFGEPILLNSEVARWITTHIPPKALLAADQMGQLGYGVRNDIIDLLGLMDREVALHGLTSDYLLRRSPDFLIIYIPARWWRPWLPGLQQAFYGAPEVMGRYELVTLFRARDPVQLHSFELWQRRDSPFRLAVVQPAVTWLGVDGSGFFQTWRVHPGVFIRQLGLDPGY